MEMSLFKILRVRGKNDICVGKIMGLQLVRRIYGLLHLSDPVGIRIEANHTKLAGESQGKGQTGISQPRHRD